MGLRRCEHSFRIPKRCSALKVVLYQLHDTRSFSYWLLNLLGFCGKLPLWVVYGNRIFKSAWFRLAAHYRYQMKRPLISQSGKRDN